MLLEFLIFKSTIQSSNGLNSKELSYCLQFMNKLAYLLVCVTL